MVVSGWRNGTLMMGCRMKHSLAFRNTSFMTQRADHATCYIVNPNTSDITAVLSNEFEDGTELRFKNIGLKKLVIFGTLEGGKTTEDVAQLEYATFLLVEGIWYKLYKK